MKTINRGRNLAYYGTTAERTALAQQSVPGGDQISPFSEYYDTDMNVYFDWYGSWVQRPGNGGGGGGGGDASAANQLSVIGSKNAGTAAASSQLAGLVYNTTLPALGGTQQASLQGDTNANLWTRIKGTAATGADAIANVFAHISGHNQSTGNTALLPVVGMLFNGTSFDRPRGNSRGMQVIAAPVVGTDRSVTVNTTNIVLMAANAARNGFGVVNDSAIDVFIRYNAAATSAIGGGNIKIRANGGSFIAESLVVEAGSVNIIAASAGAAITAWEY